MLSKITLMATAAVILSLSGFIEQGAVAQRHLNAHGLDTALTPPMFNVRFEAPVGHRQPSIAESDQAQAAKEFRSSAEISADEAYRKSEEVLRKKLIICRC